MTARRNEARFALCAALATFVSCAPTRSSIPPADRVEVPFELVESSPVETRLRHPQLAQAKDVWPTMIQQATVSLEFAEFYASNAPGSALERIIEAIESAAERGVRVRFLSEEKFYKTYPETLDRLASHRGIEVRRYPTAQLSGGVMHAKYFIVDGEEAFLGSQNFDWRCLEHIPVLGGPVAIPAVVGTLSDVYQTDWALAGCSPRVGRGLGPP